MRTLIFTCHRTWEDGFVYIADLGTLSPDDDVIFDDIAQERKSMIRFFERFRIDLDIEMPTAVHSPERREHAV